MPHFIIEYSANLDAQVDLPSMAKSLRDAAVATGVFPLGGIRVRLHRCDLVEIADGRPDAAFVHVMLRMGAGRDLPTRKIAGTAVFDHLCEYFQSLFEQIPFALSFEIVEIDSELNFKKNSIHQFLEQS